MSRRVCVVIGRGMTDNTAKWVFPWEIPVLQLVHGGSVEEQSIDELLSKSRDGIAKVERIKLKHTEHPAPDLRTQYEIMAYVDPEDDPALNPAGEYERLAGVYGMDKEFPIPCVERVYGQYSSGAFEAKVSEHAKDRAPRPTFIAATDEGLSRHPRDMKVGELRKALTERRVKWNPKQGQAELSEMLEAALAPA